MMPTHVRSRECLLKNVDGSGASGVPDRRKVEQLPQEVQLAFMTLRSRVVDLEKEALTKNDVIENLTSGRTPSPPLLPPPT